MRTVNRLVRVVLASALFALPAVASAHGDGHANRQARLEKMFAKADANNDGKVTKDEMSVGATAKFAKLDADKDGKITQNEMPAGKGGPRHGHFLKRLDANNDGVITLDEWRAGIDKRFARLDKNNDGAIDKSEFAQGRRKPHG